MSNLDFNGMDANTKGKSSTKYSHNQSGRTMKENYGRGPTTAGQTGDQAGPSTSKGGKINGGAQAKCPTNPDKINVGSRLTRGNE